MNLQQHALGLLLSGIAIPGVMLAVALGVVHIPRWLPILAMGIWLFWFVSWAASGGVPPRIG